MTEAIVYKENDTIYIAQQLTNYSSLCYDLKEKNNLQMRIINNKYGKVIVINCCSARQGQILFANSNLFNKNEHIDFKYLRDIFIPKVKQLIAKSNYSGCPKCCSLFVISEGKIYQIVDFEYMGEITKGASDSSDFDILIAKENSVDVHDERFLLSVMTQKKAIYGDNNIIGFITLNTKDYKIKYYINKLLLF